MDEDLKRRMRRVIWQLYFNVDEGTRVWLFEHYELTMSSFVNTIEDVFGHDREGFLR